MHALPPSKHPFVGRILGPAAALLRGWREPDSTIRLPPAATRTGRAHKFAVLLPDPKVTQGAPSPRRPDSPHCQLAEPGVMLAEGCFRFF